MRYHASAIALKFCTLVVLDSLSEVNTTLIANCLNPVYVLPSGLVYCTVSFNDLNASCADAVLPNAVVTVRDVLLVIVATTLSSLAVPTCIVSPIFNCSKNAVPVPETVIVPFIATFPESKVVPPVFDVV